MDIVRGEKLCPRVLSVHALDDFVLRLSFTNGETRYFDVKKIYGLPCFESLKKKAVFDTAHVEYGTVAWAGDIDYCPDTLYMESYCP